MRDKDEAIGTALQIVYEYPGWGDEHVSDMYNTYAECGDRGPCSYDELSDLCNVAEKHKRSGLSFSEAYDKMRIE